METMVPGVFGGLQRTGANGRFCWAGLGPMVAPSNAPSFWKKCFILLLMSQTQKKLLLMSIFFKPFFFCHGDFFF